MKPKRLAALLLIAFTLLSLQSAALANAAEPPSFSFSPGGSQLFRQFRGSCGSRTFSEIRD